MVLFYKFYLFHILKLLFSNFKTNAKQYDLFSTRVIIVIIITHRLLRIIIIHLFYTDGDIIRLFRIRYLY